jgi:mono/diheme cytochrome c family protein
MVGRLAMVIVTSGALSLASGCSPNESDNHRREREDAKHEASESGERSRRRSADALERGRALYKANCVACHGETGKGDGPGAGVLKPPPRDHTDRAYMSTLTDKQIADVIKMGGAIKGKPLMPSHPQFKESDLAALVAYIRSLSDPK